MAQIVKDGYAWSAVDACPADYVLSIGGRVFGVIVVECKDALLGGLAGNQSQDTF